MSTVPAEKSTTVRSAETAALRAARAMFGVLSRVAPATADERAARWFCTPRGRREEQPPRVDGWEARSFRVRFGESELAAWSLGEGPTVLLVHGWEGLARQLAGFAPALLAQGHRVVAFDLPAHGASTGEETTFLHMAEAVRAVAEVTGPVRGLLAHSLGATASAFALGQGLGAERVVLLAPALEPVEFLRRMAALLRLSPEREAGTRRRLEQRLGRPLSRLRLTEHVGGLQIPALLLHDPDDGEVPFEHGVQLAAAWPGAVLQPVTGLGHRRILRDGDVVRRAAEFIGRPQ